MSNVTERIDSLSADKLKLMLHRLRERRDEGAAGRIPRRPPEADPPPLSFAQQRLWFLDQMEPGNRAYDVPGAVRLSGPLDVAALRRALDEIVRRHEVLRTRFAERDGQPVQVIAPACPWNLSVIDLGGVPEPTRAGVLRELITAASRYRFDLARGPLFRALLVPLEKDRHALLLNLHHIVADGWSIGILVREISLLSAALAQGRRSPLAELPIQYADFAVWERERLRRGEQDVHLEYWKRQLSGLPILDLPTDRVRPAVQTSQGSRKPVAIAASALAGLQALSGKEGATLFIALLAIFQLLLHRITGQEDFGVGSPVANRHRAELENLIGTFVNTIVLRSALSADTSFRRLLAQVRETALEAYAHQELPFERLVDVLRPERTLSHNPLIQVLLGLQNAPVALTAGSGLEMEPIEVDNGTAKLDLYLSLWERPEGLGGHLEYDTALWDGPTIVRLLSHFETLMRAVAADPDRCLKDLPLLSDAERHQILVEDNDTRQTEPRLGIHQQIVEQAERAPDAVAVVFAEESLTYRDLVARARQLAHHLLSLEVGPETVVGLCLERGLDLAVALLGILEAGAVYLPLDPAYPEERLALMLEDSGASALVTRERWSTRLHPQRARVVCLDRDREEIAAAGDHDPAVRLSLDHLAYLLYTSGSTGRPKGVMVSHRNVVNFFAGIDDRLSGGPGTWLAVTSISFDISVLELLWTLARGFRVVMQPELMAREGPVPERMESGRIPDLSLFYFASDEEAAPRGKYRLLLEGARFADRHGFAAIWVPERHFHAFGGLYPAPAVLAGALATVTDRVQIRAGSVVLPLHNPVAVAEEWSVVDNLSGGRVAVSFASGWHANDFVLAPETYVDRKGVLLRGIDTVRRLWRGEAVRLRNGAGEEVDVSIHPRPIQPELPVWLTAAGNAATFRLAGQIGARLLTHLLGQSQAELADKIQVYRQAWRENGHPGEGFVTLMLHTFIGESLDEVREHVREPFSRYLLTSTDLIRSTARGLGMETEVQNLSERDLKALLDHAFERYFQTSALFGTRTSSLAMLRRLRAAGVDEVGCLIDFGVDVDEALASLELLNEVREHGRRRDAGPDLSLGRQLADHAVTHLQCTPTLASTLLGDPQAEAGLGGLRTLLVGGEALPPALAQALGRRTSVLHNMYGPTETTIWSATHRVEPGESPVSLGRPIVNTAIYILDPNLQPLPLGVAGQLFIGGSGVARGYLGRPALTAERFLPDPFGQVAGGRLYATGDLARQRPDGRLDFLSRIDHQVKIRGYRIEPSEIEAALRQHSGVRDAVVVSREDGLGGRRLIAYVVPGGGAAAPRLRVSLEERDRLLSGHRRYTLPNGMIVAQHDGRQTSATYDEVFVREPYLRHGITLEDGDCVFDVGANIGFFSLFVSQVCTPARICAFEPIPQNCAILRTNVALYGSNVEVFECGVADRLGTSEFLYYPNITGLSSRVSSVDEDRRETQAIIRHWLKGAAPSEESLGSAIAEYLSSETCACPLTTISTVLRAQGIDRIDLLKIDVEKSEIDVLQGISEADWPKIRQIVAEIHSRELLERATALLEARGFAIAVDVDLRVEEAEGGVPVDVFLLYARRDGVMPDSGLSSPSPSLGGVPAAAELRTHLRQQLPDFMIPSAFVMLESFPLTPNGKVDRRSLPAPEAGPRTAAGFMAPRTNTEELVARVWCDLLGTGEIGIHDNFFEIGGNSLLLVQAHRRLRELSGCEISLIDLFQHPTIDSMAAFLSAGSPGGPPPQPRREPAAQGERAKKSSALERQREFMAQRRSGRKGG